MGTLFVVATPIGNLSDFSARALETLRAVDVIACEDTRHTIKLLNHYGIQKPLESYHDFNEVEKSAALMARLKSGVNIALVSDAGTPAVSDPGYRIVRLCRQADIAVVPIPGPSAAIAALSASGIASDEFMFIGFLPSKRHARHEKLESLRTVTCTLIFYESPFRIEESLVDVLQVFGDREACIGREISKMHEEFLFGRLSEIQARVKPVGEFVVILAGAHAARASEPVSLEGLSRKEVLKKIAELTGIPRNQLYDVLLKD